MKNFTLNFELMHDKATFALGERLARVVPFKSIIYLSGELGAGKTTFARGFIHGYGYFSRVKSPTYTLVETYQCSEGDIHHLDLYRLKSPIEVESLGIRNYINNQAIMLVEWPELGQGFLPEPTMKIKLDFLNEARSISLTAANTLGEEILHKLDPGQEYQVIN